MKAMTKAEAVEATTQMKIEYQRMLTAVRDLDEQFMELEARCPDPQIVEDMRVLVRKAHLYLDTARALSGVLGV